METGSWGDIDKLLLQAIELHNSLFARQVPSIAEQGIHTLHPFALKTHQPETS
jgi:hypothetical protein